MAAPAFDPEAFVREVRARLEPHRNPAAAAQMARYMKDHFCFLGLPRPVYQPLTKPLLLELRHTAQERPLLATAKLLWQQPEREYQYLAGDLLDRYVKRLSPSSLPALRALLIQKAWWDSVDQLTGRVLGPLVRAHPELLAHMDQWSDAPNFWLRRAALLHQLSYGSATDAPRLFAYCRRNQADPEFFIRKAIGWALRQYAKHDEAAVRAFVDAHPGLSPLSRREALKHVKAR